MISEDFRAVKYLSTLAEGFLIRARIGRQKATYMRGLQSSGAKELDMELARTLDKLAKEDRLHARDVLKDIEIDNGRNYMKGRANFPLKGLLNGKTFRSWTTYFEQYRADVTFKGVDPE